VFPSVRLGQILSGGGTGAAEHAPAQEAVRCACVLLVTPAPMTEGFPPPCRGAAVGRLLLLRRHCKQSQFWECFELPGIEMERERRESEMERD